MYILSIWMKTDHVLTAPHCIILGWSFWHSLITKYWNYSRTFLYCEKINKKSVNVDGRQLKLWFFLSLGYWCALLIINLILSYLILSYVIMGRMRLKSQASRLFTHSIVYLGVDHRKHQSSASLAFVRGIHRWPVNSPHKGPVARKMLPFDDVIMLNMTSVWNGCYGFSFYDVCARTW